jgi:AP2-associated kinase
MYNTMPFGESILAIQNGTFVIPDDMSNSYSRDLNLFVRYMLEIDINKRPDIWQVSYITYKLLGLKCPIPNRCQSKIPDLNGISMPLTDTESRQQRKTDSLKVKSTSTNPIDDSSSLGTTVNPRERPRGMMPSSTSLINFNQTSNQRSPASVVPPPLPPSLSSSSSSSSNPTRSGSAVQLMFDDDFSQISSQTISLTNIPAKTEQIPSRARPSPPATISAASGFPLQQQLFPPPPPPSSNVSGHRRSSSQTISTANNQSSFQHASFVDLANHEQTSSSKPDDDTSKTQVKFL